MVPLSQWLQVCTELECQSDHESSVYYPCAAGFANFEKLFRLQLFCCGFVLFPEFSGARPAESSLVVPGKGSLKNTLTNARPGSMALLWPEVVQGAARDFGPYQSI